MNWLQILLGAVSGGADAATTQANASTAMSAQAEADNKSVARMKTVLYVEAGIIALLLLALIWKYSRKK